MFSKGIVILLTSRLAISRPKRIQQIAHRMCPMFKQIKANEVFEILEKLESITFSKPDLEIQTKFLQEKISIVFALLEKELTLSE